VLERAYKAGRQAHYFDTGLAHLDLPRQVDPDPLRVRLGRVTLGLSLQELDETKTQVAHGETVP